MIYIASPYTSVLPNKNGINVMQRRYEVVMEFVANNLEMPFFSPILYCHEMAKKYELPKTFGYWQKLNHHYIDISTEVWVLKMNGWEESKGVSDEIQYATEIGKNVIYVKMEDL
jgi:hypothetical protein